MKCHTVAALSLGKGVAYAKSTRQNINTKSSPESEIVGVDDAMPSIVWTRNFPFGQGFKIIDNVAYQDNQSAILLETNGRRSSGNLTRHINIRFFLVLDRIENKELRVEDCPTEDIVANILTRPLQGNLFRRLRHRLLNINQSQSCVVTDDRTGVAKGQTDELEVGSEDVKTANVTNGDIFSKMTHDDSKANDWIQVVHKRKKARETRTI